MSEIIAMSKVQPNGATHIPWRVRKMLKLKHPNYIAWVLEHGDIVVRKGYWTVSTEVRRT